jgi:hypothetical protein
MIALHHWRDNTPDVFDVAHVCTSVVRHAKGAADASRHNASTAALIQVKAPARTKLSTNGMRQKRAPLRLKQRPG